MNHVIIEQFKEFTDDYEETFNYIKKINVEDELKQILNSKGSLLNDQLYKFAFKYGILLIVKFLYEYINHPFDIDHMTDFTGTLKDKVNVDKNIVATVDNGTPSEFGKDCRFIVEDKYSKTRNECVMYIFNMKKYSKYYSKNKKYYYIFNSQHRRIKVF